MSSRLFASSACTLLLLAFEMLPLEATRFPGSESLML